MNFQQRVGFQLTLTFLASMMVSGCTSIALSAVKKKPLPVEPPHVTELPLEIPPEDGPRRPLVTAPFSAIKVEVPSSNMTAEPEFELRGVAEIHAGVRRKLGARFAYIRTDLAERGRCPHVGESSESGSASLSPKSLQSGETIRQLTYYSYTENIAFIVCMKGRNVIAVAPHPREGYQPVEGEEEIENAIDLARKDTRLSKLVQNFTGHAMLTSQEKGRYLGIFDEAGSGDRVFWVTFSEDGGPTLYWARVDLTTQEILDVGQEQGPQ